jgi:hypothetical protein
LLRGLYRRKLLALAPEPNPGATRDYPAARQAHVAQSAEHVLGKNGVMGSNPIVGSVADEKALLSEKENENGEAEI